MRFGSDQKTFPNMPRQVLINRESGTDERHRTVRSHSGLFELRAYTDKRRATQVDAAVHALNPVLELGRPSYVRLA